MLIATAILNGVAVHGTRILALPIALIACTAMPSISAASVTVSLLMATTANA